ncbi:MAG: hypothetical protein GY765_13265 [bacterium]|nr:hypothetical protein [bacterium]
MDYVLKERIGKPDLFVGRKEDLTFFLKWIESIKNEDSHSTALMARRKMGKTAVLERLFNLTFHQNDGVIPFYYEVKEVGMYAVDFCQDFFLTFIYQYIAFKTRKKEYLDPYTGSDFGKVVEIAREEGLDYLCPIIENAAYATAHEKIDLLWNIVREAPKRIASRQGEYIVQMIDEFQFLNDKIYSDKHMKHLKDDIAAGYLSTAESKVAPLLVSGSWVGWLINMLRTMLPSRFRYYFLENMPEDEAVEMIYKYSTHFDVPLTEETAFMMAELTEGSPFYISSIFRSSLKSKDLTTLKGLADTLEYETLDNRGIIKATWMEYVGVAFPRINDQNAKNIVLYICQHRDREVTRKEILEDLQLDMTDAELEKRLKALVKADIINQGRTNFDYRGVSDNIFDKVFRGVYEKEIREFDIAVIAKEYAGELRKVKRRYKRLQGKHNYYMGYFAEYVLLEQLKYRARKRDDLLKSVTRYLPDDFAFCRYSRVWRYDAALEHGEEFNLDIFARAENAADYSIIGEVKNRSTKKFSRDETIDFQRKFTALKKLEGLDRVVGFIFSRNGFSEEAEAYCKEQGIACADSEEWLKR